MDKNFLVKRSIWIIVSNLFFPTNDEAVVDNVVLIQEPCAE